jgi:O-acetyl-ADP-ribose deacetylase (regulator of RNase III)
VVEKYLFAVIEKLRTELLSAFGDRYNFEDPAVQKKSRKLDRAINLLMRQQRRGKNKKTAGSSFETGKQDPHLELENEVSGMETVFRTIGASRVEIVRGDITGQDTEAIVNAANNTLAPGGGVSGAIHRAAGPGLWEECRSLGGCATGEAKISGSHGLKARYVVHTVGPVYSGSEQDPLSLRSCYRNSLQAALESGIKSIAFPSISTGIFGYPVTEAAAVALEAVRGFLEEKAGIELVRFVLFSEADFEVYAKALEETVD